eukprot:1795498-Pyramimonas_sp.AAC.1
MCDTNRLRYRCPGRSLFALILQPQIFQRCLRTDAVQYSGLAKTAQATTATMTMVEMTMMPMMRLVSTLLCPERYRLDIVVSYTLEDQRNTASTLSLHT